MLFGIVTNYLKEKNIIDENQAKAILEEKKKVRVKMGLVAISEGMMDEKQVERVNALQAKTDLRFGDIAIQEEYLTFSQVDELLKKQGSPYVALAQVLENLNIMNVSELEETMEKFRNEYKFTSEELDIIKSDDMDMIPFLYLPKDDMEYNELAGIAHRIMMRCIDDEIFLENAEIVNELEVDHIAFQKIEIANGKDIYSGLACVGDALLPVSRTMADEDFDCINEDSIDAIGELANWYDGIYATYLSERDEEAELYPPEFHMNIKKVVSSNMLVSKIHVLGGEVYLIISMHDKFNVE